MLIERGLERILDTSARRISFLGISFKSGTDDVRESPFIELVERLLGKGCSIRIFDPNVQFAKLIGANRDYLFRVLPHVTELMVSDVSDALDGAELIILTAADPIYKKAIANARADQVIMDLAELRPSDWHGARPKVIS